MVLIEVEAPIMKRYQLYKEKYPESPAGASFEEFAKLDDQLWFTEDRVVKINQTFANKESKDIFHASLASNIFILQAM